MGATAVNWSNPDVVEQHERETRDQQAEQAVEQAEQLSTWQKLQRKREERTREIRVWGEPVEMYPLGGDTIVEAIEHEDKLPAEEVEAIEAAATGDGGVEDLQAAMNSSADMAAFISAIYDMLAEYSVDESMTRERWGTIPPERAMGAFEQWTDEDARLTDAEVERYTEFRNE